MTGGISGVLGLAMLSGCGTGQKKTDSAEYVIDPRRAVEQVCSVGQGVHEITGSVWIQADSVEASGKFPAEVLVRDDRYLDLEILNPLGGTEAQIQVRGERYDVRIPGKKDRDRKGVGSWGGIPLDWSHELFLGRVPCLAKDRRDAASTRWIKVGEELEVVGTNKSGDSETYRYTVERTDEQFWPRRLVWEKKTAKGPVEVRFAFDQPTEDAMRSPRKWEAKSRKGEVVIRWRERAVKTQ